MMILYQSRYQEDLQQMVSIVKESTYHSYAEQYVAYPEMDLFQMHFIYLFLRSLGCTQDVREMYCVCQMFIQLGLDCLDDVGTQKVHDETLIKNRQLTVLSGDHFSSYYYFYLAKKNQTDLIQKFAEVLKTVNEGKIKLHDSKDSLSPEKRFAAKIEIRSQLTNAVLSWHDAEDIWYEVYRLFLEIKFFEEDFPAEKEILAQMIHKLDQKLNQFADDVQDEFRLWLDKTQQEHLLIGS